MTTQESIDYIKEKFTVDVNDWEEGEIHISLNLTEKPERLDAPENKEVANFLAALDDAGIDYSYRTYFGHPSDEGDWDFYTVVLKEN